MSFPFKWYPVGHVPYHTNVRSSVVVFSYETSVKHRDWRWLRCPVTTVHAPIMTSLVLAGGAFFQRNLALFLRCPSLVNVSCWKQLLFLFACILTIHWLSHCALAASVDQSEAVILTSNNTPPPNPLPHPLRCRCWNDKWPSTAVQGLTSLFIPRACWARLQRFTNPVDN